MAGKASGAASETLAIPIAQLSGGNCSEKAAFLAKRIRAATTLH